MNPICNINQESHDKYEDVYRLDSFPSKIFKRLFSPSLTNAEPPLANDWTSLDPLSVHTAFFTASSSAFFRAFSRLFVWAIHFISFRLQPPVLCCSAVPGKMIQGYHWNVYLKQVRKSSCQTKQPLLLQNLTHQKFKNFFNWYLKAVGSSWHPTFNSISCNHHHLTSNHFQASPCKIDPVNSPTFCSARISAASPAAFVACSCGSSHFLIHQFVWLQGEWSLDMQSDNPNLALKKSWIITQWTNLL